MIVALRPLAAMALMVMMSTLAGCAGTTEMVDEVTTAPAVAKDDGAEVESALAKVTAAWAESQSVRYECELEYILKGTNVEKRDVFRVDMRARKPSHMAAKAYTSSSIMAIVFDGEFVFTHTKGNRFSKAPLTGDLQALLDSGRLAAYPMILIELFVAESPAAFLEKFDDARVAVSDVGGAMAVVLTRRRETITITLEPRGRWLAPTKVTHFWTFDEEVLANTDKNLQLHAFENYTRIDGSAPIPIEEMSVQNVAVELMKEMGLLAPNGNAPAKDSEPESAAPPQSGPVEINAGPGAAAPAPSAPAEP